MGHKCTMGLLRWNECKPPARPPPSTHVAGCPLCVGRQSVHPATTLPPPLHSRCPLCVGRQAVHPAATLRALQTDLAGERRGCGWVGLEGGGREGPPGWRLSSRHHAMDLVGERRVCGMGECEGRCEEVKAVCRLRWNYLHHLLPPLPPPHQHTLPPVKSALPTHPPSLLIRVR